MSLSLLIVLLLLLIVVGGLPTWQIHPYGYGPSGLGAVLLLVVIVLLLTGRLR